MGDLRGGVTRIEIPPTPGGRRQVLYGGVTQTNASAATPPRWGRPFLEEVGGALLDRTVLFVAWVRPSNMCGAKTDGV